jgi:hypothetical protein
MGPRCLINDITCENTTCLNDGECIPVNLFVFVQKNLLEIDVKLNEQN